MAYTIEEKRALMAYHSLPSGSEFRLVDSDWDDLLKRAGGVMPNPDGSPGNTQPRQVETVRPVEYKQDVVKTETVETRTIQQPNVEFRFDQWLLNTVPQMALMGAESVFASELANWIKNGVPQTSTFKAYQVWNDTLDAEKDKEAQAAMEKILNELEQARRLSDQMQGNVMAVEKTAEQLKKERDEARLKIEAAAEEAARLRAEIQKLQSEQTADSAEIANLKGLIALRSEQLQKVQGQNSELATQLNGEIERLKNNLETLQAQKTTENSQHVESIEQLQRRLQEAITQAQQNEQEKNRALTQAQADAEAARQAQREAEAQAQTQAEAAAKLKAQIETNKTRFADWIKTTIVPRFIQRYANGEARPQLRDDFWKLFDLRHWSTEEIEKLWVLAEEPGKTQLAQKQDQRQASTDSKTTTFLAAAAGLLYFIGGGR